MRENKSIEETPSRCPLHTLEFSTPLKLPSLPCLECPPVTPGLESTTGTCDALREQNDTLRQELHDIRRVRSMLDDARVEGEPCRLPRKWTRSPISSVRKMPKNSNNCKRNSKSPVCDSPWLDPVGSGLSLVSFSEELPHSAVQITQSRETE